MFTNSWPLPLQRRFAAGLALFTTSFLAAHAQEQTSTQPPPGLTLQETIQRVLDYNESIQVKMLEHQVAIKQYKAERGIFEPALVGSYDHVDSHRENTEEQRRNLFGAFGGAGRTVFDERNNIYNGGLEFLSPVGSRFRVGYTLRDLSNNLNATTPDGNEYVTTVGVTLTQPLLKGFGLASTMARIRLASLASDLAFQDYRRQLMLIVSRAEAAYWDLYLTQEQERISRESVNVSETILKDNRARVEAGRSSQLEVLQSEAGAALRRSRFTDAFQKRSEAANQLFTLFSGSAADTNFTLRATDQPLARDVLLDYYQSYRDAFDLNPDYLYRRKQAVAEKVRLAFAKNQRLPQLDLKASYGLNGLADNMGSSWTDISEMDYPAWSVGVEMRVPITGGIKERNDYAAAKLNQKRSLVSLKEIEVQIGNALDTSMLKVRNLRQSLGNYESVVSFHQQLLETQMARLEVGQIESRLVLETEEKLFEARMAVLDTLVQYQKALLELELIQGAVLRNRGIDMSKKDLQQRTEALLTGAKLAGPQYELLRKEVESEYERVKDETGLNLKQNFVDAYEKRNNSPTSTQPDPHEPARRVLREKMRELDQGVPQTPTPRNP